MSKVDEYGQAYDRLPTDFPRPEHQANGRPAQTMVRFLEQYHGRDGHPMAASVSGTQGTAP